MVSQRASRTVAVMIAFMTAQGTIQAADKVRWEDLHLRYSRSANSNLSGLDVVMNDGSRNSLRRPRFHRDGVSGYGRDGKPVLLPRLGIAQIKIWRKRRYRHQIGENLVAPLLILGMASGGNCNPLETAAVVALVVPMTAFAVGSVPVLLVADGLALLKPPKVFDIVP